MLKLNLGSGGQLKPTDEGWVNIDARELPGVQQVIDLEVNDLPYQPSSVDHIQMQDFLEHLGKHRQRPFLEDVYNVLKPLGTVFIQIPHLGVLAKRYCDVLEKPTELQHPIDGNQLAAALYGGQDYEYNTHKWGYDEASLIEMLESIGFAMRHVNSDGGQNLLCTAIKPPKKVYLAIGGGLGDAMQVYLAQPISIRDDGYLLGSVTASSDPTTSTWFRRLASLESKGGAKAPKVVLVIESHNPHTKDLFEYDPNIDEVISKPWPEPTSWAESEKRWEQISDGATNLHEVYFPEFYEPDESGIYMPPEERKIVDRIVNNGRYIVIHPYAGSRERVCYPMAKYRQVIDMLIDDLGYNVVVVGASYKQFNVDGDGDDFMESFPYKRDKLAVLVNKVSVRVSFSLALACSGFIGTHSAMILASWMNGIRSVCIVPPVHDDGTPWETFFASKNPTTWGADKEFNKTIIVRDPDDVSTEDIVGFFR